MAKSKIGWTDVTDNIIVAEYGGWWCRRISPGCDHRYAEGINQSGEISTEGVRQAERDEVCLYVCRGCDAIANERLPF